MDQCFRISLSTPFVLIVFPFLSRSLTQGETVASAETHSVQVVYTWERDSYILCQSTLHLSWDSLVSGSTLNFSMISRDQLFSFSHRPVRRISSLDITRSTPLGSTPSHPCRPLLTPYCNRVSNLYRPGPSRTPFLTPWFHVDVHFSIHLSMKTPFD